MKRKVMEYNAIFQKEKEGGYSVWVPSLNGCASQGETFEEALKNLKEAIHCHLEGLFKDNIVPLQEKDAVESIQTFTFNNA